MARKVTVELGADGFLALRLPAANEDGFECFHLSPTETEDLHRILMERSTDNLD